MPFGCEVIKEKPLHRYVSLAISNFKVNLSTTLYFEKQV